MGYVIKVKRSSISRNEWLEVELRSRTEPCANSIGAWELGPLA